MLEDVRAKILPALKTYGVLRAAVFGSFARGEQREDSDLDILVELSADKSLLDLAGLKLELEEILGRKVDVVTYRALNPRIKQRVLEEQVTIL